MGSMVYKGSRQPALDRLLLQIKEEREPKWAQGRRKQMDKWIAIAAAIPTSGVFAWAVVRFIEWRRELRASMWEQVEQKS